jgi:preprotein translocase subunit SecG
MAIALGVAVIVLALVLIVAVLMQSGKDTRLSGTIAGGAETFFGKSKANTWDKMLSKVTVVLSIVFALVVIAMYLFV